MDMCIIHSHRRPAKPGWTCPQREASRWPTVRTAGLWRGSVEDAALHSMLRAASEVHHLQDSSTRDEQAAPHRPAPSSSSSPRHGAASLNHPAAHRLGWPNPANSHPLHSGPATPDPQYIPRTDPQLYLTPVPAQPCWGTWNVLQGTCCGLHVLVQPASGGGGFSRGMPRVLGPMPARYAVEMTRGWCGGGGGAMVGAGATRVGEERIRWPVGARCGRGWCVGWLQFRRNAASEVSVGPLIRGGVPPALLLRCAGSRVNPPEPSG